METAANAVLPCAAAAGLEGQAEALYRRLPLPARYGSVKHVHAALGDAVQVGARRQQGDAVPAARVLLEGRVRPLRAVLRGARSQQRALPPSGRAPVTSFGIPAPRLLDFTLKQAWHTDGPEPPAVAVPAIGLFAAGGIS